MQSDKTKFKYNINTQAEREEVFMGPQPYWRESKELTLLLAAYSYIQQQQKNGTPYTNVVRPFPRCGVRGLGIWTRR